MLTYVIEHGGPSGAVEPLLDPLTRKTVHEARNAGEDVSRVFQRTVRDRIINPGDRFRVRIVSEDK